MAMAQSFFFQYLSAKGKGQSLDEEHWGRFIRSVILNSPITGAFGSPITALVQGNAYSALSNTQTHPTVPLVMAATGIVKGLLDGKPGESLYYLFKNGNSYSGFKNFPGVSAIWNKYFMANLYDYVYPENNYRQSQEGFANDSGLSFDF